MSVFLACSSYTESNETYEERKHGHGDDLERHIEQKELDAELGLGGDKHSFLIISVELSSDREHGVEFISEVIAV